VKRAGVVICLCIFLIAPGAFAAQAASSEPAVSMNHAGQKNSRQSDKPSTGNAATETHLPSARPQMASIDEQVRALAADLDLGEEQRAKLKSILQAQQEFVQAVIYDRSISQEERLSKFHSLNETLILKIRSLLNQAQSKKFDQKIGKRGYDEARDDHKSAVSKAFNSADVSVPALATDLRPATYKFQVKFDNGGQQRTMNLSTTIREENLSWTVTDVLDAQNGQVTDMSTLEKGNLILRKRSLTQGSVSVNLAFTNKNASGSLSISGVQQPISADLAGPLFADSAGWEEVVACLPLSVGYTTSFRNFDLQEHSAKLMQLKVAALERVTVPAGTFDAFRVELTPADGGPERSTVWISNASREPVKVFAVLGAAGRATMSAELAP
jgi:hypothetical protein